MAISISDYQTQLEDELNALQNENDKINSQIEKTNKETDFEKTQIDKQFEQMEPDRTDFWMTVESGEINEPSKEELLETALELLNLL